MSERMQEWTPAEMTHPSVFILEELDARDWTLDQLAIRMGGDSGINRMALDLYIRYSVATTTTPERSEPAPISTSREGGVA